MEKQTQNLGRFTGGGSKKSMEQKESLAIIIGSDRGRELLEAKIAEFKEKNYIKIKSIEDLTKLYRELFYKKFKQDFYQKNSKNTDEKLCVAYFDQVYPNTDSVLKNMVRYNRFDENRTGFENLGKQIMNAITSEIANNKIRLLKEQSTPPLDTEEKV